MLWQFKLLNPLTPGAFFPKMRFLDILVVFRLHFGQFGSFNLVQKGICNTIVCPERVCPEHVCPERVFFPFLFFLLQ